MAIIKTLRKHRFTSVDSQLGENPNLSFAARGLALHLLCKPENWDVQIKELLTSGKIKKATLRQAMIELEREGYLLFCRTFEGKNKLRTYWQLFETPLSPSERSRSWENKAIVISPESSPAFVRDEARSSSPTFSGDDKAGDLVNIHDSKYSLGEVSPKTPLQSFSLRLDSVSTGGEGEPEAPRSLDPQKTIGIDASLSPLNGIDTKESQTPSCASPSADTNPPAIAQNRPLFDSGVTESALAPAMQSRRQSAQKRGTPRKAAASDSRAKHPAIQAVRECMGRYPNKIVWDDIIAALGETVDMEKLRSFRKEQIKRGINPQSLIFCLEWYPVEIPQAQAGRPEKGQRHAYVAPY